MVGFLFVCFYLVVFIVFFEMVGFLVERIYIAVFRVFFINNLKVEFIEEF